MVIRMKKVLLIGELDQILGSLNHHLAAKFQTQMCTTDLDLVKAMCKVYKADIAVVCLNENGDSQEIVLDFLRDRFSQMPVLLIGKEKECRAYNRYYENKQFDYLTRPLTLGMLLRKCEEMLKIYEPEAENAQETAPEERK